VLLHPLSEPDDRSDGDPQGDVAKAGQGGDTAVEQGRRHGGGGGAAPHGRARWASEAIGARAREPKGARGAVAVGRVRVGALAVELARVASTEGALAAVGTRVVGVAYARERRGVAQAVAAAAVGAQRKGGRGGCRRGRMGGRC